MLNVRVKKALLTILTACLTVLMMVGAVLGFMPTPQTVKAEGTKQFVKVTEAPDDWSGTYLIVHEDSGVAFDGGLTTLDAVSNTINVTINDGAIAPNEKTNAATFTITKSGDNYTIQSKSGYYIGQTSNANGLKSSTSTSYANTLSINSDSSVNAISGGAYLRFNATSGQTRFRYYASGKYTNQQPIHLYRLEDVGGSGSEAPVCKHENMDKTVNSDNVTYNCTECDYSYIAHTITFNVPQGIIPDAVDVEAGKTVQLPSAENYGNYTFAGWAETTLDGVTTTAPTLHKADDEYTMRNANTTLYAVYSYTEEGSGSGNFEKVTENLSDWSGEYLIVYENGASSVAFNGGSAVLEGQNISIKVAISDGTIVGNDTTKAATFKITTTDKSKYSIQSASGYHISRNGSSAKVLSSTDPQFVHTIAFENGTVKIQCSNATDYRLQYNESGYFRYYKGTQKEIALYKLDAATVYYTTNIGVEHVHSYTETPVEPTCTTAGGTQFDCSCDHSYFEETKAALGHDYQIASTTPGTCQAKAVTYYECSRCPATKTEEGEFGGHNYVNNICSVCEFVDPLSVDYSGYYYFTFNKNVKDENDNIVPATLYVKNDWDKSKDRYVAYANEPTSELSSYLFRLVRNEDGTYNIYEGTSNNLFAEGTENVFVVKNGEYYNIYNADKIYFSLNKTIGDNYMKFYGSEQNRDITFVEYKEIVSAGLTLGKELVMNYNVAMDDDFKTAKMTFTLNGVETTVAGTKDGNVYVYSFPIAPQFMGEEIKAELKLDGTVLTSMEEYSVKAYADYWLENSDNESMKQLLRDLLHYGAAAQLYQGHNEDTLVNKDIEANENLPTQAGSLKNSGAESYPVYFAYAGVNFSSDNKIFVELSSYDENVELVVTVDGTPYELTRVGNTFYTEGLKATEFDKTFTFTLSYNGELMQTLTYSVNAYAYALKDNQNDAMAKLAIALYNYGVSAQNYVA